MSESSMIYPVTQHAMLVAWGDFARQIGLLDKLSQLCLHQKGYQHRPQTKVMEFLVATLAGYAHLKEISHSACPLDCDRSVAQAWGETHWADYSGVSRTLKSLSLAEAQAIVDALVTISQPFLAAEINLALWQDGYLVYDGDLTGLPICKSSHSYPDTAYGHMDDAVRLGYQAAVMSLRSPSYRRFWLAGSHHPGNSVSAQVAQSMILAAEAQTGLYPWRRTDLLQTRIQCALQHEQALQQSQAQRVHKVQQAQQALEALEQAIAETQARLQALADLYQAKQRLVRPTCQLAQVRKRLTGLLTRKAGREKTLQKANQVFRWGQGLLEQAQQKRQELEERLSHFEQDNARNRHAIHVRLRLDAGFGTYDNLAWYIEMGYEVYTKAPNHKVVNSLAAQVPPQAVWESVGKDAQMFAWSAHRMESFVYPLDVGVERFQDEQQVKHSLLLHFGPTPVTQHLVQWFDFYNQRQTIEAGIKESKQVFYLHRLKVRSVPAIYLQENCVLFAANLIRWACAWLNASTSPEHKDWSGMGSKELVHVAAHTAAEVVLDSKGRLLRFTDQSRYAGKVLRLKPFAYQLPLPLYNSYDFGDV